jgi:superfamily I DNA and/or RNA helicase
MTDDSSPDSWNKALDQMTEEISAIAKRCEFISDWLKDIEAEPSDITACYWDHLQVFFSTCVGVGSWRRLVDRGRDAVDLVIIDEAAHATATETLIPLLYAKRAILIGDEMQLPPIMPNNIGECGESCSQLVRMAIPIADEPTQGIAGEVRMAPCWLGCSYFEWIWRARPNVARTMLDTQFRMHPDIADFIGSVFYPEGLVTGVSAKERELGFGEFSRPVCMISTSAYENRHEEFLDPGYRNELEAAAVRRVIEKAEAELKIPQEFGVITPYSEQKQLINLKLEELLPDLKKVRLTLEDVASVDSFQGSERDVIIVSFARSPKPCGSCQGTGTRGQSRCDICKGKGWRGTGLTFARDLRRLNVAFSRARKVLILIGDIEALTDARYRGGAPGGKVLNLFKEYVANQGKVLHLWERNHGFQ